MGIVQLLGCGFLTLVLWMVLEQYKSPLRILVVTAFGALVMIQLAEQLGQLVQTLLSISAKAGVHTAYFTSMLKMVGIAWLTEFLCQTCRDAGNGALAIKLEFAAKIAILLLIAPVLGELLQTLFGMF